MLILSEDINEVLRTKDALSNTFEMVDLGEVSQVLGMKAGGGARSVHQG